MKESFTKKGEKMWLSGMRMEKMWGEKKSLPIIPAKIFILISFPLFFQSGFIWGLRRQEFLGAINSSTGKIRIIFLPERNLGKINWHEYFVLKGKERKQCQTRKHESVDYGRMKMSKTLWGRKEKEDKRARFSFDFIASRLRATFGEIKP